MFLPSRKYVDAVVLSVASGVLLALSVPGPLLAEGLGFLAAIALLPLFYAIESLPTQAATNLKPYMRVNRMTPAARGLVAFSLTWVSGSVFFAISFSWVVVPILRIFKVGYPSAYSLYFLYCLASGLLFPVILLPFILSAARAVRKFAEPFPLWTMIVFVTAIEVWMPRMWPWTFGSLVRGSASLDQWVSVFGASALTPLVLVTSASLARSLATLGSGMVRFLIMSGGLFAAWILVWALGAWRLDVLESRVRELKTSEIIAVHPAFLPESQFRFEIPQKDGNLASLLDISEKAVTERLAAAGKPELVVWPEGVLPDDFLSTPENLSKIRAFTAKAQMPLLFAAFEEVEAASQEREGLESHVHNSAMLVRADGSKSESYSQSWLVPFLDKTPLLSAAPAVAKKLQPSFPIRQVSSKLTFVSVPYSPDYRYSSLISFDVANWKLVQKAVSSMEIGLFVHLANGVVSSGTYAMRMMEDMAKLRALESGRSVLSVFNAENPVVYNPVGRKVSALPSKGSSFFSFAVPVFDAESMRSTFFTDFGNFPLAVATFIAFIVVAFSSLRRGR